MSFQTNPTQLKHQVESDVISKIEQMCLNNENLKLFHGTGEIDGETDWELLKRHVEVWAHRHPEKMAAFLLEMKKKKESNLKDTGASQSNDLRIGVEMPPELFQLFQILSPNFLGQKEITADARKKKFHSFMREFPVFRACKKV